LAARNTNEKELPVFGISDSELPPLSQVASGTAVSPTPSLLSPNLIEALIGTARRIQPSKSWSEPFSCWTAIVGASGAGKTPGLDVVKRALAEIEHERQAKNAELRRQHETNSERAKAKFKAWKEAVEADQ
jgi:hypothetical protein